MPLVASDGEGTVTLAEAPLGGDEYVRADGGARAPSRLQAAG